MRLTSELWVRAYLRARASAGAMAVLARKGDAERGAIWIVVFDRERRAVLFGPAPSFGEAEERRFVATLGAEPRAEADIAAHLARQTSFDDDMWIVEVEDAHGCHGLDDWLER
jgi:hypothetical protein